MLIKANTFFVYPGRGVSSFISELPGDFFWASSLGLSPSTGSSEVGRASASIKWSALIKCIFGSKPMSTRYWSSCGRSGEGIEYSMNRSSEAARVYFLTKFIPTTGISSKSCRPEDEMSIGRVLSVLQNAVISLSCQSNNHNESPLSTLSRVYRRGLS